MDNSSLSSEDNNKNGLNEKALKEINDGWGLLEELGENRFVINAKKESKDIEKTTRILQRISAEEDALRESEITKDEMNAGRGIRSVTSPAVSAIQSAIKGFDEEVENEGNENKSDKKSFMEPVTPKINLTPKARVKPEEKIIISKPEKIIAKQEQTISEESNLKLLAAGLSKSYQNKTNNLLNPLKFLMEKNNLKNVIMALAHMIIPLFMTWYITQKIPFIAEQLTKETPTMICIYVIVFYFACVFIWFIAQLSAAGLTNVFKKIYQEMLQNGKQELTK